MTQLSLACLTIVRNESHFLPRWINHYTPVVGPENLYVLDHDSDDGSTSWEIRKDRFSRTPISNEFSENVQWLKSIVQAEVHDLLNKGYRRVLFSEADELLVADPERWKDLNDFLQHCGDERLTTTGYDVIPGRRWIRNDRYDKTLITANPIKWEIGFHRPETGEHRPEPRPDLLLIHLHYADQEVAWERLVNRQRGKTAPPGEGGWAVQNKYTSRSDFDAHFAAETAKPSEFIPERFHVFL